MKKTLPQAGLVVRYDYLWCDEAMKVQQEGAKDRPCAVIQSVQEGEDGKYLVLLAPVTHTLPHENNEGVEIPYKVTRHLGLDDQRQRVRTTELNRVSWDDPGIIPASSAKWEYGRLPKGLYDQIKQKIQKNARSRKASLVKREGD